MELTLSWQNVVDGQGIALALMGMSIVFASLAIISIVTGLMPRLLVPISRIFPEKTSGKQPARRKEAISVTLETVAAIGCALHHNSAPRNNG